MSLERRYKIVYCTPALYMAGGVERVLTLKANYFAEVYGYDVTIILTEGTGQPLFYPLSDKVKVINLDINFEELWTCSFIRKIFVYLRKQQKFKKELTSVLMSLRPDITVSLLRREVNFMTKIKDGSKKVGELHVNRANYRNYESNDTNIIKQLFSKYWMNNLTHHLRELDRLVVLTEEDRLQWTELNNVDVIPDPLSFHTDVVSPLTSRRVIAVGRYVYQKGFDMLLQAWSIVEKKCDWELVIYGQGNRSPYEKIIADLDLDRNRCHVYGPTNDIKAEYLNSSAFVFSSRFEGFGMVLIEAMACGLPVVSFDCPCGPKDIVSDQVDGYLVPNGDVEMLADKLLCLILHPDDAKRLSEGAIRKAGNYTIDVIARRWKSLYNSLWEQV